MDAEQLEAWEHNQWLLIQELGNNYYKINSRDDQQSEEDPFEAEERVRWLEEEEEVKSKYFKMIAEEEERGYCRQTVSEIIEEKRASKKKKREMEEKRKEVEKEIQEGSKGN